MFKVNDPVICACACHMGKKGLVVARINGAERDGYLVKLEDGSNLPCFASQLKAVQPETPERRDVRIGDIVKVNMGKGVFANCLAFRNGQVGKVAKIISEKAPFSVQLEFPDGVTQNYTNNEVQFIKRSGGAGEIYGTPVKPYFPPDLKIDKIPFALRGKVKDGTMEVPLMNAQGEPYTVTFTDISVELFRSYQFPEKKAKNGTLSAPTIIRIDNPKWLYVAPSGSHRIIDAQQFSHYVPCGWLHLWWKVKAGTPYFVR